MNWRKFVVYFFGNLVLGVILAAGLLGALGFLLAGQEGFVNLAIWGAALGLIGGFSTGLAALLKAEYWGAYAGRYAAWWLKHETEGEPPPSKANEKKTGGICKPLGHASAYLL